MATTDKAAIPVTHGESGPAAASPGFTSAIPGMKTRPVAHEVQKKTRDLLAKTPELHREYNALSRTIRIVNRATQGPLAGAPFLGIYGGEQYPDEVDGNDPRTWLQPGEYMDVPRDVAFHLVGNLWDPTLPDRTAIVNRYGGPTYARPEGGKANPGAASMNVVGLPALPDLVVAEINARGKEVGPWIEMFELYTRGMATILEDNAPTVT